MTPEIQTTSDDCVRNRATCLRRQGQPRQSCKVVSRFRIFEVSSSRVFTGWPGVRRAYLVRAEMDGEETVLFYEREISEPTP